MEAIVRQLKPNEYVSITAEDLLKYIDGYNRFEYVKKLNPITFGDIYRIKVSEQVDMDLVIDYFRNNDQSQRSRNGQPLLKTSTPRTI